MSHADVKRDIEETAGSLAATEWESFKCLMLSDRPAIPNKYKDEFVREFDQIAAHARQQMQAAVPA